MKVLKTLLIVLILTFANLLFSQSESNRSIKMFELIDENGNEVISIIEMTSYCKDKANQEGELLNPNKIFDKLDTNKNRIITLYEFLEKGIPHSVDKNIKTDIKSTIKKNEVSEKKKSNKPEVKEQEKSNNFNIRDINKDQVLSEDEFVDYYKSIISKDSGKPLNGKFYFYSYDKDLNGEVSLEEFMNRPNWNLGKVRLKNSKKSKKDFIAKT